MYLEFGVFIYYNIEIGIFGEGEEGFRIGKSFLNLLIFKV